MTEWLSVVSEFRNKLRMAEEMMAKFSYSLREIQRMPNRRSARSTPQRKLRLICANGHATEASTHRS